MTKKRIQATIPEEYYHIYDYLKNNYFAGNGSLIIATALREYYAKRVDAWVRVFPDLESKIVNKGLKD